MSATPRHATLTAFIAFTLATAACAGKTPETRYYQLSSSVAKAPAGRLVIVLEPFETEAGYDDERIVYRTTPYRLDYYEYHRWSAPPGVMIGNFLAQALARSGTFRAVVREATEHAPIVVRGRVLAIEEVDTSKAHWLGRISLEIVVTDSRTGDALWIEQFEQTESLRTRTPEGLAQALSIAVARIATDAAPQIAALADRQAQVHASLTAAASK